MKRLLFLVFLFLFNILYLFFPAYSRAESMVLSCPIMRDGFQGEVSMEPYPIQENETGADKVVTLTVKSTSNFKFNPNYSDYLVVIDSPDSSDRVPTGFNATVRSPTILVATWTTVGIFGKAGDYKLRVGRGTPARLNWFVQCKYVIFPFGSLKHPSFKAPGLVEINQPIVPVTIENVVPGVKYSFWLHDIDKLGSRTEVIIPKNYTSNTYTLPNGIKGHDQARQTRLCMKLGGVRLVGLEADSCPPPERPTAFATSRNIQFTSSSISEDQSSIGSSAPVAASPSQSSPSQSSIKTIEPFNISRFKARCEKKGIENGIPTALGCIPIGNTKAFVNKFLQITIGIAGVISFLVMLWGSFLIMSSAGNPEKVQQGKEFITSAIGGLLLIIFSLVLLKLIGIDILGLPGFKV